VDELMKRKVIEEISKKELEDFVQNLISAKALPHGSKPAKSSWLVEAKVREKIESLVAYATDNCKSEDQRKIAKNVIFHIHTLLLLLFLFLQFRSNNSAKI
jgi:exoribonuclease II